LEKDSTCTSRFDVPAFSPGFRFPVSFIVDAITEVVGEVVSASGIVVAKVVDTVVSAGFSSYETQPLKRTSAATRIVNPVFIPLFFWVFP